jgi:NAD(P)-dependent dehydrogenase (short-subunit alcohol dehydrogenase family)
MINATDSLVSRFSLQNLEDGLLEKSVVGSFTSAGYKVRSRHWDDLDTESLAGKVVAITGATSGIGRQVATEMAVSGARLRLIARNRAKVMQLVDDLRAASGNVDISFYIADLSRVEDVLDVADQILDGEPAVDVLINNAVVLPPERLLTDEGLELSHATNLVAPFALTNRLIPRLVESAPARIINVISGGMYTQGIRVDDLQFEKGNYRGSVAYARAKRGLMILTKLWAEQLSGTGVTVNATHPGWVNTPGVQDSLPAFYRIMRPVLRTPEQGADTIMWLAASPEANNESGKLWHDRQERTEYRLRNTRETEADRVELWNSLQVTVDSVAARA